MISMYFLKMNGIFYDINQPFGDTSSYGKPHLFRFNLEDPECEKICKHIPCRKAFRHDLGMTSWIQRLQW